MIERKTVENGPARVVRDGEKIGCQAPRFQMKQYESGALHIFRRDNRRVRRTPWKMLKGVTNDPFLTDAWQRPVDVAAPN